MTDDAAGLCATCLPGADIAAIDWLTVTTGGGAGITAQWLGMEGEVLTLFEPVPGDPADLIASDLAALLADGAFLPGSPLLDGLRIRGATTARAAAGAGLLDIAARPVDGGASRLVLQRPAAAAAASASRSTSAGAAATFSVEELVALVDGCDDPRP